MKLNSVTLAAAILFLLFGGIGFSSMMNWWQTESQKVPVKYSEGEAAGQYNPADIRGSYTFGEVSELFEVPLIDLQIAFHVPADADPAAYQVKQLEEQFADLPVEIGTSSVRMFIAMYKGLPFDLTAEEETYLIAEAVEILEQHSRLTAEQLAYLANHTLEVEQPVDALAVEQPVDAATAEPQEITAMPESTPQIEPTIHAAEEFTVTGKTSFQQLLDWGVPQEDIETIIGEKMPAPQMLIKDYASAKGITFSELKGKIQAEVDLLK